MKKVIIATITVMFLALFVQNSFAENEVRVKLTRGLKNVFTFPLEIPYQACKQYHASDTFGNRTLGTLGGACRGISLGLLRFGSGLWDVATCNLDIPKGGGALLKPDYVWDKE